jgi:intraflagellar transport protein 46
MSGRVVHNQHVDQTFDELSEDESNIEASTDEPASPAAQPAASSSEDDSEDEGDEAQRPQQGTVYNPDEYKNLRVSQDVQSLFEKIQLYTPVTIDLETKLKPFIPDYIPAVGEIDAFVKVPRPDNQPDRLGLHVLDEIAAQQTDPTVLEIMLKQVSKTTNIISVPRTVRSIEHADKNPQKITTWVKKIDEVHRGKPLPSVHYSKPMPDIERLMQVWPPQFEEMLNTISLPTADIKLDVSEYAKVVCAILDIPVYDKTTESLHVLFTLYSEFRHNCHFQSGETSR